MSTRFTVLDSTSTLVRCIDANDVVGTIHALRSLVSKEHSQIRINDGSSLLPLLHFSVKHGKNDILEALLDNREEFGILVNALEDEAFGKPIDTPLQIACWNANHVAIRLLVVKGKADCNLHRPASLAPIMMHRMTPKATSGQSPHVDGFALLLMHGANPNAKDIDGKTSLLHVLVSQNSLAHAKVLLEHFRNNLDIDVKDVYGFSPLQLACSMARAHMIELFLKYGSNLSRSHPRPLLHITVAATTMTPGWSTQIVRVLLEAGVDVNERDADGFTVLHQLVCRRRDGPWDNLILPLLVDFGADLNGSTEDCQVVGVSFTPLMMACFTGSTLWAYALLNAGADPSAHDPKAGAQALHLAAMNAKSCETLDLLLGPLVRVSPLVQTRRLGLTIWHAAVLAEGTAALQALVERNLPGYHMSDFHGLTPLHYAVFMGSVEKTQLLLSAGVSTLARDSHGRLPLHFIGIKFHVDDSFSLLSDILSIKDALENRDRDSRQSASNHDRDHYDSVEDWFRARRRADQNCQDLIEFYAPFAEMHSMDQDGNLPFFFAASSCQSNVTSLFCLVRLAGQAGVIHSHERV